MFGNLIQSEEYPIRDMRYIFVIKLQGGSKAQCYGPDGCLLAKPGAHVELVWLG